MYSGLHQQVISIVSEVLQVEVDPSTEDLRFDEIKEWDSISHLRLVMEIEQMFGITLSDKEVVEMASLANVKEALSRRGVTGAGAVL